MWCYVVSICNLAGYNGTGQGYDSNNRYNGTLKFKKSMFNN